MNVKEFDVLSLRRTESSAVNPAFVQRWSPRAFSGEGISQAQVEALLEAARWAPSCFNAQPWRFIYAVRDDDAWPTLLSLLVEPNQAWAKSASALMVVISRNRFEHNDNPALTNNFDAGAAWMSLALQASYMGLAAHGMRGFDIDAAREKLAIPEVYDIDAMLAVGHPGEVASLPEPYQERETPSPRIPLSQIAMSGRFQTEEPK